MPHGRRTRHQTLYERQRLGEAVQDCTTESLQRHVVRAACFFEECLELLDAGDFASRDASIDLCVPGPQARPLLP